MPDVYKSNLSFFASSQRDIIKESYIYSKWRESYILKADGKKQKYELGKNIFQRKRKVTACYLDEEILKTKRENEVIFLDIDLHFKITFSI